MCCGLGKFRAYRPNSASRARRVYSGKRTARRLVRQPAAKRVATVAVPAPTAEPPTTSEESPVENEASE